MLWLALPIQARHWLCPPTPSALRLPLRTYGQPMERLWRVVVWPLTESFLWKARPSSPSGPSTPLFTFLRVTWMVLIKVLANLHLALSLPYSVITSIHQINKYSPDCRLFYSFKMNNHLLMCCYRWQKYIWPNSNCWKQNWYIGGGCCPFSMLRRVSRRRSGR